MNTRDRKRVAKVVMAVHDQLNFIKHCSAKVAYHISVLYGNTDVVKPKPISSWPQSEALRPQSEADGGFL